MKITEKTKLKDMNKIYPLIKLWDKDLITECAAFKVPEKINGIKPLIFSKVPFSHLAALWDIKDSDKLMSAIVEIFFYSQTNKKKDVDQWVEKFLNKALLIDFYNFANSVIKWAESEAKYYGSLKVELSDNEKKAGYGKPDKNSIRKMIDTFAKRQHISSLEEAGNYSNSIYKFVFTVDVEEANKQRAYNKIISAKK